MGVLEAGQQGPAAQVDGLRLTARQVADLVVGADRDDPCRRCTATAVAGGPSAIPIPAPLLVSSVLAASPPAVAGTIRRPSGSTV